MECKPCLDWCIENRVTLTKMESTLEFDLRIQELIEMIRKGEYSNAIKYAKLNMKRYYRTRELQKTLALMAFPANTKCAPYKRLLDPKRWDNLVVRFRLEMYRLHCVPKTSLFETTLQAGLSALKTQFCYNIKENDSDKKHETWNMNCPVCMGDTYGKLAKNLPYSHHVNSSLICPISLSVMDDQNIPLAMPSGHVYGKRAVYESMAKNKEKLFVCPKTNKKYKISDMRKVYIS